MNILGRNMMVKEVLSNVCLPFLRASRQARQLQTEASQVCRKLAGPWRRAHANTGYETFGQERKPETEGRTKTNIDGSKYASEKRVRYTEHRAKRCQNPHHGYVWRCDILPTSYEWFLHIFAILRILYMRHLHAFAA